MYKPKHTKEQEQTDWYDELEFVGIRNIIKKQLEDDPEVNCGKAVDNSITSLKLNNLACG